MKSDVWPPNGTCKLCGSEGPLRRSHISPKFVGDWVRRTGITSRLRFSEAPNRLVEDTPWRYLLCEACEQLLSPWENATSTTIFLPLHEDRQTRFRYGPWFAKFCASVTWREIAKLQTEGTLGHLAQVPATLQAEQAWRAFLVGKGRTPAPHELHALPLDAPSGGDIGEATPHLSRYLRRIVAASTQCIGDSAYVLVKMARLLVVGVIAPGRERRAWQGTKIHAEGGTWGHDQYHVPGWLFEHLKEGARRLQDAMDTLSARQKRKTKEAIISAFERDPSGVANSDMMKAFENDLRLFGRAAFQQPIPDDTD